MTEKKAPADWCDYCYKPLPDEGALVRVPGEDTDGNIHIQLHCGQCEPDDTEDPLVKARFVARVRESRPKQ